MPAAVTAAMHVLECTDAVADRLVSSVFINELYKYSFVCMCVYVCNVYAVMTAAVKLYVMTAAMHPSVAEY